jgi:L-lactate dehydrogenase complex protein LldG
MSDARSTILTRIRRSLGAAPDETIRGAEVARRLAETPRGVIPARGQLPRAERLALFRTMVAKVSGEVVDVAAAEDVPTAIADYLRRRNLPLVLRRGADPALAALPFAREPALDVSVGASAGDDLVGLSHAVGAIAESGTLVLVSGPDNPSTLNFLPDYHLVMVEADTVAGDMETLIDGLRARYGRGQLPRTVNLITGPSRSADIEQTLLLGAHGPRALLVVLVGAEAGA